MPGQGYKDTFPRGAPRTMSGAATLVRATSWRRWHFCIDNAGVTDYTVVLPAAATMSGVYLGFIGSPALTRTVTIDGAGAETINGAATITLVANQTHALFCDGTRWVVMATSPVADPLALAHGGTGAADAGTARTNLGLGSISTAATLTKYQGSATLEFTEQAAGNCADLTITVTGANVGDCVMLGFPVLPAGAILTGFVSATDTVTVRYYNASGSNLALGSGGYSALILK